MVFEWLKLIFKIESISEEEIRKNKNEREEETQKKKKKSNRLLRTQNIIQQKTKKYKLNLSDQLTN